MKEGDVVSGEVIRQLTDQTKDVFAAALLFLWVGTLKPGANGPVSRGPLLGWAIGSVLFFVFLVLVREKISKRKFRWVSPFVGFALMWVFYWISGLPLQSMVTSVSTVLGVGLLAWSVILLISLIIVMKTNFREGRLGGGIRWFVTRGADIVDQISSNVFMVGVILGLVTLLQAGMTGWWMPWLIVLGMIILLVVGVIPVFSRDGR